MLASPSDLGACRTVGGTDGIQDEKSVFNGPKVFHNYTMRRNSSRQPPIPQTDIRMPRDGSRITILLQLICPQNKSRSSQLPLSVVLQMMTISLHNTESDTLVSGAYISSRDTAELSATDAVMESGVAPICGIFENTRRAQDVLLPGEHQKSWCNTMRVVKLSWLA